MCLKRQYSHSNKKMLFMKIVRFFIVGSVNFFITVIIPICLFYDTNISHLYSNQVKIIVA